VGTSEATWAVTYIITVTSTSEVKVTGVLTSSLVREGGPDLNGVPSRVLVENATEDFSLDHDISVQGIFDTDDIDNEIRTNQIYIRLG